MAGLVSALYKVARIANDVRILSSGNPKRITRHYANKALGRYVVSRMYFRRPAVRRYRCWQRFSPWRQGKA